MTKDELLEGIRMIDEIQQKSLDFYKRYVFSGFKGSNLSELIRDRQNKNNGLWDEKRFLTQQLGELMIEESKNEQI